MNFKNRTLLLIPARGGSKRLPGKNVKLLCGKPLISWTIEQAIESDISPNIIVSSDDQNILEICTSYESMNVIPHQRPTELGVDTATTADVVLDVLNSPLVQRLDIETVILLQPTSPLRNSDDIIEAFKKFENCPLKFSLISVSAVNHPSAWNGKITSKGYFNCDLSNAKRTQDYPVEFRPNGAICIASLQTIISNRSLFSSKLIAYKMPDSRSIDIDNEHDFSICEFLLSRKLKLNHS